MSPHPIDTASHTFAPCQCCLTHVWHLLLLHPAAGCRNRSDVVSPSLSVCGTSHWMECFPLGVHLILALHMRKPRPRETKPLAQDHTASTPPIGGHRLQRSALCQVPHCLLHLTGPDKTFRDSSWSGVSIEMSLVGIPHPAGSSSHGTVWSYTVWL